MENVANLATLGEVKMMKSITVFSKGSVAAVLLAGFLISGTVWAQMPNYQTFSFGNESCGVWLSAKEDNLAAKSKRVTLYAWIGGYLTAYSLWQERGSGPVSEAAGLAGAFTWIDNYCRENPLKLVDDAALRLIFALRTEP